MDENKFKVKLVRQTPFKLTQVVGAFNIVNGAIYKGAYLTTAELLEVEAAEHDYADNYETNTRWTYELTGWTDSHEGIPEDSRYSKIEEVEQLRADLETETAERLHTDGALQANIDAEQAAREQADTDLNTAIETERSRAIAAEETLQATIDASGSQLAQQIIDETKRAENAELELQNNIDDEATARKDADTTLQTNIDNEVERAKAAEQANADAIAAEQARAENAEFVLADEVDKKVDKISTENIVYGVTTNGQRGIPFSASANAYSIAYRDVNGELAVGTPTTDASATNKAYVDDALDNKVDKVTNTNNTIRVYSVNTANVQESIEASFGLPASGVASIPLRTANSNTINVGTPTTNNHATNKAYVDALDANNVKLTGKDTQNIAGHILIQGDLTVNGTTTTNDAESLAVKDNLIITNSEGAELNNLSGLFIKTTNTDGYVIALDPTTNAVILGEATIDSNNEATVTAEERKAIVTRRDSNTFTEGNVVAWGSSTENIIADTGIAAIDVATKTGTNRPLELGFSGAGNVIQFSGYSADDSAVIYVQPDKNIVRWYFRKGPSGANACVAVGTAQVDDDAVNRRFADGRYLQLTGGTLAGSLRLGTSSLQSPILNQDGNRIVHSETHHDYGTINVIGNTTNRIHYEGSAHAFYGPVSVTDGGIRVSSGNTITIGNQQVYHPGNKPTPADIGAVATTNSPSVVYGTNANTGAQGVIAYSSSANNALVFRDNNGQFNAATPTNDNNVANKKYVDDNNAVIEAELDTKLTIPEYSDTANRYQMIGINSAGNIITSPSDPNPNANTLAARGNSGELKVAPPSVASDAVNLEYLQNNYTPKNALTDSHNHTMKTIVNNGNEQVTGEVSDLYWALFPFARGNRFAWMPEECVTFEQSDDGTSWTTLTVSEQSRNNFFTTSFANNHMSDGKLGTEAGYNVNSKFRVTINNFPNGIEAGANRYFGNWTKTLVWVSTNGCSGMNFKIERSTIGEPENFIVVRENIPVSGWSGPNDISHNAITFGGNPSQTAQTARVRFTFGITDLGTSTAASRPQVLSMMAFSKSVWNAGNGGGLANNGDLYQWDYQKNALFPKAIFEDLDSGDAVRVYSPNNKPTPQDINAILRGSYQRLAGATATLDDCTLTGFYNFKYNVQNTPDGRDGMLMVMPWDSSGYPTQFAITHDQDSGTDQRIYTRHKQATTWTPWYSYYGENNKPTAEDVGAVALSTGGTVTGNILLRENSYISAPYNVARGYRLGNNNIQALVFDDVSGRIQVGNSGLVTDINAQNGEVYVNDGSTKQPVYSGFNIPAYGDVLDTRSENTTPAQYLTRGYGPIHVTELKQSSTIGLPSGNGDYATVTTAIPWNGPSGGEAYQIAVAAPQSNASQRRIYARFSQSDNVNTYGNWGSWYLMYSTVEGETGGGGGVSTMLVFNGEAELSSELEDGATYAEIHVEQSLFNRTPKISEQFILFARYGYVKYDLICTVVSMASGSVTVEASYVRKITVFTTHNITVYADRQSQETTRFGFTVALRRSSAIMGTVSVLPTLATEIQGKAGVFNPTDTAGPGAGSLKYIPASGYYMPAINKKHSVYGIAANAGTIYVLYYDDESGTGTTVNYFALNSYTTVYVADAVN